jgi:uncharacterized membrane protein
MTPAPPEQAASSQASVQVGLIATTSLEPGTVAELAEQLAASLSRRYPDVRWEVPHVRDRLVTPPVNLTELVEAARTRLLEQDWDLAVCLTDLPLRLAGRPLLTHSSPTHGVALVSLPAFGARRVTRRMVDAMVDAVAVLIGDTPAGGSPDRSAGRKARLRRRLVELATDTDDGEGVAFLARVITGNVRLLAGMIRANQPWRLVGRLSRALLGALAAASFALVSEDLWRIAADLDDLRLAVLAIGSIAIAVVTLISAHNLWERATDPRVREQVILFNLVTVITVTFGIASLYVVVLTVSLAVAAILIDPTLFESAVRHPVGVQEYLRLACVTSSLATVGGALGGVLESDETVREAAYAYRAEDQTDRLP